MDARYTDTAQTERRIPLVFVYMYINRIYRIYIVFLYCIYPSLNPYSYFVYHEAVPCHAIVANQYVHCMNIRRVLFISVFLGHHYSEYSNFAHLAFFIITFSPHNIVTSSPLGFTALLRLPIDSRHFGKLDTPDRLHFFDIVKSIFFPALILCVHYLATALLSEAPSAPPLMILKPRLPRRRPTSPISPASHLLLARLVFLQILPLCNPFRRCLKQ